MTKDRQDQRPGLRKLPRQARSTDTVRVIVEAAARILEADGLTGFNTNAVAERAGVSVGTLYQYFPGKDAIVAALIVRETTLLIDEAEATLGVPSGSEALSSLIVSCVAHQLRRPTLARLLDFEEARLPFDEDTRRVGNRLEEILVEIAGRLELPGESDVVEIASDVLAIIKGMVDAAGARGELDQDHLRRRVERAVFGFIATSHGRV